MIPKNGIYIIQGELNHVVAALRRNNRWSGGQFHQDDEQDPLLKSFATLKETLQNTSDPNDLDPIIFLGPFLEVIRSEDTTGPITGVALSSVNKFLSYGLIDPSSESAITGIDNLADAVTHARFVGTDPSSDEVVLMKILQVLRTLLLSPVGIHMTNESVCEIMQSCFRICFEMRLSELLRKTAEQTLIDMVQLLFLRLPQFKEDSKGILSAPHIRKMFKRSGPLSSTRKPAKRNKNRTSRQRTPTTTRKEIAPVKKVDKTGVQSPPVEHNQTKDNKQEKPELAELAEVKNVMDNVEETTCDDINVQKTQSKVQKMIPLSEMEDSNTDKPCDLTEIDPDKMKSIESDLDKVGINESEYEQIETCDGQVSSKTTNNESLNLPLTNEGENEDNKDNNLETFKDHGVISLHYPEEDARSCDSLDVEQHQEKDQNPESVPSSPNEDNKVSFDKSSNEYVNQQGVRFTAVETAKEGHGPLVPYGLPCVRELLRFLTTLINPDDRHNTNTMIHIGLSLLTIALESGGSHIGHFHTLMHLIKDDVCRNIFTLLQCDIHILFALSMRVSFLLFEALRGSLRFQFERFLCKLMDILSIDNINVPYEKREMALEYINQIFHIPCLVQEVYVNFDCDLHTSNVLEDLGKTLSKNAFRAGNLASVNLLALDALLTIVNEIELHCNEVKRTMSDASTKNEKERTVSSSSEVTEYGSDADGDFTHTSLPLSGYAVGKQLLSLTGMTGKNASQRSPTSEKSVTNIFSLPSIEDIVVQKRRKKLLNQGIDEFNKKPKKGIEFFQEHGLLSTPLNPSELVVYLKENPRIDKKIIGDYIGDRKNAKSLEAFVNSFEMVNVRIDEALRNFLETFRLPGESPVIAHILEVFTAKYFEGNPTPYKNTDAAFTLAYAVIMLNVDQHNKNVKQQKSMTVDEYKRNLRQTNGGEDFPAELLEEIYDNIRNNEIVMPSERVGKVKEIYEWKVLMKKSSNQKTPYIEVKNSIYDEELFLVLWGPTVAALSYVYDNSTEKPIIQKTIQGFRKLAFISAHYNLSEVFDNLLISLCKFTSLLVTGEPSDNLPVLFGSNMKSQLSARTVFSLAHKQGDILREGWQNLLVCMLQLLKAKLLPTVLTEVEDFVDQSGKISLIKEEPQQTQKPDNTGVFAAFYSYMLANPDTTNKSNLSLEEKQAQDTALSCIKECHPENIITESKFLRPDSLLELVKALIIASKPEHSYESTDVPYDGDAAVFFLEFLIKIALQNRDRISLIWQSLRDHLSNIIISAPRFSFLVERAVVGLLRLAVRLIRRDDISAQVLITLRILLMMHPTVLLCCSKQISYGLHELIRTNASSIQYSRDWITILTLLQVVGAGASPPIVKPGPCLTLVSGDLYSVNQQEQVDTETGELLVESVKKESDQQDEESKDKQQNGEQWLLINKNLDEDLPVNQYDLTFKEKLNKHDGKVFIKASSSIGFIVRDMAHVKDFNIFQCIYATLVFGEAASNGGLKYRIRDVDGFDAKLIQPTKKVKSKSRRLASPSTERRKNYTSLDSPRSEDEAEIIESTSDIYDAISLQLLDLMYALHTNARFILGNMTWENFSNHQKTEMKTRWSSKESLDELPSTFRGDVDSDMSLLWVKCWCPLLQGIARFCCDVRRDIRMAALTILQRALLAEDLQSMTATEWENCFNQVLFPMLASLLEVSSDLDPIGLEDTRMRAATLLCKAFLQHLNTFLSLTTFTALWMTILDFMDKYMHADNSDSLFEAIPESLKNMLLVMSTAGIFEQKSDGLDEDTGQSDQRSYSALWQITWDRIDCFLPNLKSDLMATQSPVSIRATSPPEPDVPGVITMHTEEEIAHKNPPSPVKGVSAPTSPVESPEKNPNFQRSESSVDIQSPSIIQIPEEHTPSFSSPPSLTNIPSATQQASLSPLLNRASSPLLTEEPPSLNITLHAPLPHISPPGIAHVIKDNQAVHPIPILLPPMNTLSNTSLTSEINYTPNNAPQENENDSCKNVEQEKIVPSGIQDI